VAAQGGAPRDRLQGAARRGRRLPPGGGRRRSGHETGQAFTLAFKGVLLEGLEVVFIVVTFGDNQKNR